jgi:hypothetical protein
MLRTLRSPEVESTNWLAPFVADFRCCLAALKTRTPACWKVPATDLQSVCTMYFSGASSRLLGRCGGMRRL